MNVVTGFGVGVGPHIINGVLDELEKEGTQNLGERLTLRPFPYAITDAEKRRNRWTLYRTEMISRVGVAVYVFGNKADSTGNVVSADGMLEEFDIACDAGLLVVPVGTTGYVAGALDKKVSDNFQKYFSDVRGLKAALAALGQEGTPTQMVDRTIKFVVLDTEKM
jgi:hypothetical protein